MDRNLPNRISDFSYAQALNMGGSFASFACFAVELHYSGYIGLPLDNLRLP